MYVIHRCHAYFLAEPEFGRWGCTARLALNKHPYTLSNNVGGNELTRHYIRIQQTLSLTRHNIRHRSRTAPKAVPANTVANCRLSECYKSRPLLDRRTAIRHVKYSARLPLLMFFPPNRRSSPLAKTARTWRGAPPSSRLARRRRGY